MPPLNDDGPRQTTQESDDRQRQQLVQDSGSNEGGGRPIDVHFRDIAPALEFMCWVIVLLAPVLRLINGQAVTDDQFGVQVAVFSLSLAGALGLRFYQILRR